MANDRMAIVCRQCQLGMRLTKYYPSGGFISGDRAGWGGWEFPRQEVSDFFFELHKHDFDNGVVSGKQYYLGYESDNEDWKYDDRLRK